MTIKSSLSVLALVAGVAFAGSAYAQTSVAGFDVSDADLPKVQAQCDALALEEQNGDIAGTDPTEPETDEDGNTNLENDTSARNASTTIDLELITLEDCRTAGLIQ